MLDRLFDRLAERFDPDRVIGFLADIAPKAVTAVLIAVVFYVAWRFLAWGVRKATDRAKVDATAQAFLQTVLKYALFVIALVTALGELGINTTSIIASLGIAGLTIGFAAKDALSNVLSGIFIFWDRPFVIGDLIEVDGNYGRVDKITLRSTRVVTVDGRMLAVPNTQVVNSTVTSYTNFPHLRIDVDLTIGVNENLGSAREILLGLVSSDDRFMKDPAPSVVVTALNDYNVALQLRAWIDDEQQHVPVRFELREKVFEALRTAGVEMPYETLQLAPVEVQTMRPDRVA